MLKHDKIVGDIAIKEALKMKKSEDFVQFKIGRKIFKIIRL